MSSSEANNAMHSHLLQQIEELRYQLQEANDTIEAIRTGQIDALVVEQGSEHQIYTLRSADHSYRVFVEKMTEGAITINKKGNIQYCNYRFADMVECPLVNVIGEPFINFIVDDNKAYFHELVKRGWSSDSKGEILLVTSGSKTIPVQLSLAKLNLEDGLFLSVIVTDLTAQKAIQLQLEEKNRELEISNSDLQQFASVASHDLQEPVRKIQIFSNLIKQSDAPLPPDTNLYLDKIIESSSRMRTLIVDILNYSRLSAKDSAFQKVNLNELINELKYDFELVIQEKQAIINIHELPEIIVNKGQIRQVFQNLISNALKFSTPGLPPHISIFSRRIEEKAFDSKEKHDGPFCIIHVKDNGIGFDEKYIKNIFALFERLNPKDTYSGTGIGMAIAKKIIDKHNGLITATSKEGYGSDFMIVLPMK